MATCSCYCIAGYRAPIASSDVSFPGFPKPYSDNLGFRNIELDYGEEMWDGDVTQKDYDCDTKIVSAVTTTQAVLPRNLYFRISQQNGSFVLTWWGPIPYPKWTWGPWTLVVRIPIFRPDRDTLAAIGFTPWCPDTGFSCP